MDLRNYKDWNRIDGLLSVNMEPHHNNEEDSKLHVMLNGNTGNFCLDYTDDIWNKELALQRAWSSDTGYYVKILPDNNVNITRWWDGYYEQISAQKIIDNPKKFYSILSKEDSPRVGAIIAFAKEAFIKLRNCVQQSENGQESLRMFMYLLAALEENTIEANNIDSQLWHLKEYDSTRISQNDWTSLFNAFNNGVNISEKPIRPLISLVLRHASNRLFQEAHREATRKIFQMSMFGGTDRKYDSGISDGAYYTPTPLVRTIVQEALWALNKVKSFANRPNLRILDPACGSGEFLRETLRQLKMLDYTGSITIIGWDISEIACEMATFVLHYEKRNEWDDNAVEIIIEKKDSLEYDWANAPSFDILLMNPPFISFENLGDRKDLVQEKLSGLVKRQPDGAALFWKKASEAVSDEGVLGLVLPHSFLSADTYEKLRNYIKEEVGMEFSLLARLGSSGLFEKAMIIPSLLIGIKKVRPVSNTILWTDFQQKSAYDALRELRIYRLNEIPTPIVTNTYSIYEDGLLTNKDFRKNWAVNSYKLFLLSDRLKEFNTVGKIFQVTRGIDTGNNEVFLISKNEWLELPKKEQAYFKPCIMRDSIQNGMLNDNIYVFYPYGKYEISTENELKEKVPKFYSIKRLDSNKVNLQKRRGKDEKWWELSEPRFALKEHGKKIISAYFGKSGYFGFDHKGKFLVGHGYAWLPKKQELNEDQYYFGYLAILHAPIIDTLLEMVCNVLDGGYYNLSKRYVENMPLPDLSMLDGTVVAILSQFGRDIHEGRTFIKDSLNMLVANIYGIDIELFK